MSAAIAVGLLVAAGIYLLLQRGLVRIAIGFVLLGHAANILIVAAGGMRLRDAPLLGTGDTAVMADPLPQAFVLTAIVITFGVTVFMLALARSGGDDDPEGPADPDAPPPDSDSGEPASPAALAHEAGEAEAGGEAVGLTPRSAGQDPAGSAPAASAPDSPRREAS